MTVEAPIPALSPLSKLLLILAGIVIAGTDRRKNFAEPRRKNWWRRTPASRHYSVRPSMAAAASAKTCPNQLRKCAFGFAMVTATRSEKTGISVIQSSSLSLK